MFAVWVTFRVNSGRMSDFMALMRAQARNSVANEIGCMRFDVLKPREGADTVNLYEVYEDENAFEHHLESDHFLDFRDRTAGMVEGFEIIRLGVDTSVGD